MSILDLHIHFKITTDKNAQSSEFGGCPAFTPDEIDSMLNQAYIEIISNKFTGSNTKLEAFEGSVKRISDLENLVKTDTALAVSFNSSSNVITLNDFFKSATDINNRMFFIEAVLNFGNSRSVCSLVDHETAQRFLKTYNNYPWIDSPVVTIADNKLKVFIDTYKMVAPYTLDVTYVKYPEKIDNTQYLKEITEVPEYVLYEVINRAAVIALENVESQRSGTKLQLNNMQE